jgi:hypothetical protein
MVVASAHLGVRNLMTVARQKNVHAMRWETSVPVQVYV